MDVERALVSKIISTGQIEEAVAKQIRPEHFADDGCREVYEYVVDHVRQFKTPPSLEAAKDDLPDFEWLFTQDALDYLIKKQSILVKRRMADDLVVELAKACDDPERAEQIDLEFIDAARQLATAVPSASVSRFSDMDKRIEKYERDKKEGNKAGIPFGFPTLDELTFGIQDHELVALSAFTGVGKSTFIMKFASNCWVQGYTPLYISLEMEASQILRKIDALIAGLDYKALKGMELPSDQMKDWVKLAEEARNSKADIPIIDSIRHCTVDHVYAEMTRHAPDVCIVDFVQLMKASRYGGQKWQDMEEVAYGLKEIARVSKIPIVIAVQTNRLGAKEGADLSNVGSGIAISQASDILIGMHQDVDMRERKDMELRLQKNRDGKLAIINSLWDHDTLEFREKLLSDVFGKAGEKKMEQKEPAKKEPVVEKDEDNPFIRKARARAEMEVAA